MITVLMPVYNAERYLRQSIESILTQSYQSFEFLIINDGSTDNSEKIINSYKDERIRYIKNEKNLKLIATLNKGIDLAQGDYIARMDADDIALPDMLSNAMQGFSDAPYSAVVNQRDYEMNDEGTKFWKRRFFVYLKNDELRFSQLFSTQILHPGIVIKTDILRKYRYRNEPSTLHREDFDLWRRLLKDGNYVKVLSSYAVLHRRAPGSITATQHTNISACLELLRNDLADDGFVVNDNRIKYWIGYRENMPILVVSKCFSEIKSFFKQQAKKHHLQDEELSRLNQWAIQTITQRALHDCKTTKGLFNCICFLLKEFIVFKRWFWKNCFGIIFKTDVKPIRIVKKG